MIAGESVAKAAERCGVLHHGVSLATSVPGRARRRQAARLSGIVEADETFILESFKGRRSDLPREPRKRGGKAASRGFGGEDSRPRRPRPQGRDLRCRPAAGRQRLHRGRARASSRPATLICDGGKAIAAFARQARIPFHVVPAPGKPKPEAPISTSTTSTPTTAGSRNGSALPWRRHQEPPELSRLATSPRSLGASNSPRKTGSWAPSERAHTNS